MAVAAARAGGRRGRSPGAEQGSSGAADWQAGEGSSSRRRRLVRTLAGAVAIEAEAGPGAGGRGVAASFTASGGCPGRLRPGRRRRDGRHPQRRRTGPTRLCSMGSSGITPGARATASRRGRKKGGRPCGSSSSRQCCWCWSWRWRGWEPRTRDGPWSAAGAASGTTVRAVAARAGGPVDPARRVVACRAAGARRAGAAAAVAAAAEAAERAASGAAGPQVDRPPGPPSAAVRCPPGYLR